MRTRKSDRNKLTISPLTKCERQTRGPVPLEVCTAILSQPLNKLSSAQRKRLLRARESVVLVTRKPAKEAPVKFAYWLNRRSIYQVNREIRKAARRAATAKYLLADLSEKSLFRPAIQLEQDAQLHRLKQAVAERDLRIALK